MFLSSTLNDLYTYMSIRSKPLMIIFLCISAFFLWRFFSATVHARSYVKMTGTTSLEARFFKDLRDRRLQNWSTADAFFIASGIREDHELKKAQRWLKDLKDRAVEALRPYKSTQAKADHLLRWIHSNAFSHYQASSTDALQLIKYGKFNCLSSCILYGIVADLLGIKVNGIAVDRHAFCKVYASQRGRKSWDVETTTALGFNPGRNVKISNAVVSVPRNKYRNRREMKILEMIGLIYTNHVGLTGAFPTAEDRLLAYQKAALFLPKDQMIQHNVLAAHTQVIQEALQRGRWSLAQKYLQSLKNADIRDRYFSNILVNVWQAHYQRLSSKNRFQQSIDALQEYAHTSPIHLKAALDYLLGQAYASYAEYDLKKNQYVEAEKRYMKAVNFGQQAQKRAKKYRRKYNRDLTNTMKVQDYNYWVSIKNNLVKLYQQNQWSRGLKWTKKSLAIKSRDPDLQKYKRLFTQQVSAHTKNDDLNDRYQRVVKLTQQERWQDAMDVLQEVMPQNRSDAKPFRELYKNLDPIIRAQAIVDLVNQGDYKNAHRKFQQLRKKYRSNKNVQSLARMMKTVPRR